MVTVPSEGLFHSKMLDVLSFAERQWQEFLLASKVNKVVEYFNLKNLFLFRFPKYDSILYLTWTVSIKVR